MKHSVAGIVCKDSLFFIARRLPQGDMGNRWEFPGGKVENGETFEESLVREFAEEFSLAVTVGKQITESFFVHRGETVALHAYEVFFPDEDISWILSEHSETDWVPLEEIENRYFVDSDLQLLPGIKIWLKN